jgi:hypothetical protein
VDADMRKCVALPERTADTVILLTESSSAMFCIVTSLGVESNQKSILALSV